MNTPLRREIEEFFQVHRGERACLLGNGPSLLRWDLRSLADAGYRLIGINKSWTHGPAYYHTMVARPHFHDLCEGKFSPGRWNSSTEDGDTWEPGVLFCSLAMINDGRFRLLSEWTGTVVAVKQAGRLGEPDWFSADMRQGHHARFGGMMAIELALWMGFDEAYMLGYDAHVLEGHHFDPSNKNAVERRTQVKLLRAVAEYSKKTRTRIFNANEDSAIRWFEFRQPQSPSVEALASEASRTGSKPGA